MSFADWDEEDLLKVKNGLSLLGWTVDTRLTSDDALLIAQVAYKAIDLNCINKLTDELIDALSFEAYEYLWFQIMNPNDRASFIAINYKESKYLGNLISTIDEAIICWYRGYYLASSALLFIAAEKCMRNILGWKIGDPDPSFNQLKNAINVFDDCYSKEVATKIINIIYSHYNSANPTQFYFNRHGLLHGMRTHTKFDELNSVRLILLFDLICKLENIVPNGIIDEEYNNRIAVYSNCLIKSYEQRLLSSNP